MATFERPQLLLLDEHTAALDPKGAEQVLQLTQEIVSRLRLTTLMVTHSLPQAVRLGDRVLMMHRGRVVHDWSGIRSAACGWTTCWRRSMTCGARSCWTQAPAAMLERNYV